MLHQKGFWHFDIVFKIPRDHSDLILKLCVVELALILTLEVLSVEVAEVLDEDLLQILVGPGLTFAFKLLLALLGFC